MTDAYLEQPLVTDSLLTPIGKDTDGRDVFLDPNEVLRGDSTWSKVVATVKGKEVPLLKWNKTKIGNVGLTPKQWVNVDTTLIELDETEFTFPDGKLATYQDALDHFTEHPDREGSFYLAAHLLYGDDRVFMPVRDLASSSPEKKSTFLRAYRTYLDSVLRTYSDPQKPFGDLKIYDRLERKRPAEYPLYFKHQEAAQFFVTGICAEMQRDLMGGHFPGSVLYYMQTAIGGFGLLPHEVEKFIANGELFASNPNELAKYTDPGIQTF